MDEPSSGRVGYNLLRFQQRLGLLFPRLAFGTIGKTQDQESIPQAKERFSKLNLEDHLLICQFGIGEGHFYLAAKEWLQISPSRNLLFFEDSEPSLRAFLERELATEILNDPQVHICPLLSEPPWTGQIMSAATYFSRLLPTFTALPGYEERALALFRDFAIHHQSATYIAGPALDGQKITYRNFYQNALNMKEPKWASELYGAFKGVPGIVCGAGPSLKKSLPYLQELTDHALIIGAGSGVTALTQNGIEPHLSAGLCPNPLEGHRFWHSQGFEVPIVYRSRIDASALSYIHGEHIYTNGCEGIEPLAAWFEKELGIPGEAIESGPSVFFFAAEILRMLGCNPILFVGLDLSLGPKKEEYAPGVTHGSEGLLFFDFEEIDAIDIHGRAVTTYNKWRFESFLFGHLAKMQKETNYLNATGGGIGVPGVENVDLSSIDFDEQIDIQGRVHSLLSGKSHRPLDRDRMKELFEELKKSLERCASLLDEIDKELRAIEKSLIERILSLQSTRPDEPAPWRVHGKLALLQADLEEEIAYRLILHPYLLAKEIFQQRVYDQFTFDRPTSITLQWQQELSILREKKSSLAKEARDHLKKVMPNL